MKLKVAGFGEFDLPEKFSFREMNLIQEVTNLKAGEIYPALARGDTNVLLAFSLVAIKRSDKLPDMTVDQLLDLDIDEIEVVVEKSDTAEGDGSPPAVGGETGPLNGSTPLASLPATTEIPVTTT